MRARCYRGISCVHYQRGSSWAEGLFTLGILLGIMESLLIEILLG